MDLDFGVRVHADVDVEVAVCLICCCLNCLVFKKRAKAVYTKPKATLVFGMGEWVTKLRSQILVSSKRILAHCHVAPLAMIIDIACYYCAAVLRAGCVDSLLGMWASMHQNRKKLVESALYSMKIQPKAEKQRGISHDPPPPPPPPALFSSFLLPLSV